MESVKVCRMCLAKDVPLHLVGKKYLQEMFEQLTAKPFVTDDSRPEFACLICCAKLRNCYQFMKNCLLSDKLLQHMLNSDEVSPAILEQLPCTRKFGQSRVVRMNCTDNTEQLDDIKVKKEVSEADETSEEDFIQDDEEQDSEPGATADDVESVDGSELDKIRATVKSEPNEADDIENDIIQWSDTEFDKLSEPKSSNDIPLKTLKIVLKRCDNILSVMQAPRRVTQSLYEDTIPYSTNESNVEYKYNGYESQDFAKTGTSSCSYKPLTSEKQKIPIDICARPGDKQLDCGDLNLNLKSSLVNDMQIHFGDMPYKCTVCDKYFSEKSCLDTHNLVHIKPYKCNVCSKSYSQNRYLIEHHRIHTGETPYTCKLCNKFYFRRSDLYRHNLTHTDEINHNCNVCGKSFLKKIYLQRHYQIHTGEKTYTCKICNKCYSDKRSLDTHHSVHTGEKPYECNICDKRFRLKAHLDLHHRIHTGIKPYKCHICNKFFRTTTNLKKHVHTHTGDKPYECTICNNKYNQQSHLDRHIRTHMDDRKYECYVCSKTFIRRDHLIKHIRIHTRDK